jgi:hypothetical protein
MAKQFQPEDDKRHCKKCGTPLGRFVPDAICARCLLQTALSEPAVEDDPPNSKSVRRRSRDGHSNPSSHKDFPGGSDSL